MFTKNISAGVQFLIDEQLQNGNFISFSSTDPSDFTKAKKLHTIFPATLILLCLNQCGDTPIIRNFKQKIATFLLSQKSEDWSFNYWQRKSKEEKKRPYPDDLDVTMCALAALYECNPKLIDGAAFAKIISLLTAVEVKEGGPYRTWLVTEDSPEVWKDVDIAVNANIAYFLFLQDIELPKINSLIDKAISTNGLISPYYNSDIPILYFISRFYKGKYRTRLINYLLQLQKQKTIVDSPLLNAFIILSLLNFKIPYRELSDNVDLLIKQQSRGAWSPYGFYIDLVKREEKQYVGSKALTTAFCVLALSKYSESAEKEKVTQKADRATITGQNIHAMVVQSVMNRFTQVDKQIKRDAEKVLSGMLTADEGKQITLLPFMMASSLGQSGSNVPQHLLVSLGSASLYGWLAYTIYDNFLDEEGNPKTMPIANIALRELTLLFTSVFNNSEFAELFNEIMDRMDKTNSWEVNKCRCSFDEQNFSLDRITIPDYGNYQSLAHRSMGHALASTAILFYLGHKRESSEVKLLLKFFYHYIIARQLNDDAHDFVEDLSKGHLNPVGAAVLKGLKKKYGNELPKASSEVLKLAQELFWKELVVVISNDILKHSAKARRAIELNAVIEKKDRFLAILSGVESSAHKALEEHANVTKFLETYK